MSYSFLPVGALIQRALEFMEYLGHFFMADDRAAHTVAGNRDEADAFVSSAPSIITLRSDSRVL